MNKNKIVLSLATLALGVLAISSSVNAEEVKEDGKVFYVVESGDTLSEISEKYDLSYLTIQANNDILNPDVIHVGNKFLVGGEGFDKDKTLALPVTTEVVAEEVIVTEDVVNVVDVQAPVVVEQTQVSANDGSPQYAAERMAQATGTDVGTWLYIIQAESTNNSTAMNSTGHYGYFQIAPVHGMPAGASVDTQIDYAIRVYNSQGFGAWEVM